MSANHPVNLKADAQGLSITWSDGITHRLTWVRLRQACPCASCKARRESPPVLFEILKPEETLPIRALRLEPLGNYAYHIDFSDGHNSGFYSIDFLRRLGESDDLKS